jgi:hypothetical protein
LIVELLITKGARADSSENVRVSDLVVLAGRSFLTVYGTERRPVPISGKLAVAITAYSKAAELTDPNSPLFPSFSTPQRKTSTAACGDELFKELSSSLKKAGVSQRV